MIIIRRKSLRHCPMVQATDVGDRGEKEKRFREYFQSLRLESLDTISESQLPILLLTSLGVGP
jgi:hypothetical protein